MKEDRLHRALDRWDSSRLVPTSSCRRGEIKVRRLIEDKERVQEDYLVLLPHPSLADMVHVALVHHLHSLDQVQGLPQQSLEDLHVLEHGPHLGKARVKLEREAAADQFLEVPGLPALLDPGTQSRGGDHGVT